jgi:phage-related protein (TIGR01555 family)
VGKVLRMFDGLRNLVSGLGTTGQDKQASATWVRNNLQRQEIDACYGDTWLGRKIHDVPCKDMTREWRSWQADDNQIEAIEKEEARLKLQAKTRKALILARLYGGAAMVLGLPGDANCEAPVKIGAGQLQYVHVVHRYQLTLGDQVMDPLNPLFGGPSYYALNYPDGRQAVNVHPSRVIPFIGQELPDGAMFGGGEYGWFWGDPLLQSVQDALKAHDTTTGSIAALLNELKLDVIKFPGLMDSLSSGAYEGTLIERMTLANVLKSLTNALILDGGDGTEGSGETWETRQLNMQGMPDIQRGMFQLVAGAADIPATRLIGQSPTGLNATGDSDTRNYYDMLASMQETELRPTIAPLDEYVIMSGTGSRDPSIYYDWTPLWQMTPTDKADRDKKVAETAQIYANMGAVPDDAFAVTVQNRLIEDNVFPGLEAALEEAEKTATMEMTPEELLANTPPALQGQEPGQPPANDPAPAPNMTGNSRRRAANDRSRRVLRDRRTMAMRGPLLLTDAVPKPLYVSRKVLNGAEIVTWAKAQGFKDIVPADSMHVTIAASREPVDWLKMGEPGWGGSNGDGQLTVSAGGPRVVEPLGDGVVLMFSSWELGYRHGQIKEAGASWDFSDYVPHVTISYDRATNGDLDMDAVVPFTGKLQLGPEVFEPFQPSWRPSESE